MTNPTPHGQVPEALIDLIDAYAETRHRCGGIYNARTEAARKAVIEALSGVQALSAAPAVPAGWKAVPVNPTPEMWKAAKTVPDPNPPYPPHYGLVWDAMLAASPTSPAEQQAPRCSYCDGTGDVHGIDGEWRGICTECDAGTALRQQAAPKVAPGEQNTVPAEWLEQAYREGWAACRDAETIGEEAEDWAFGNSTANSRMIDAQQVAPQQEAQEPVMIYRGRCTIDCGEHGHHDVELLRLIPKGSKLYTAPQPAPAPLSDDTERLEWLLWKLPGDALRYVVGELSDTSSGAEFRAAIDAARKQGGRDAG